MQQNTISLKALAGSMADSSAQRPAPFNQSPLGRHHRIFNAGSQLILRRLGYRSCPRGSSADIIRFGLKRRLIGCFDKGDQAGAIKRLPSFTVASDVPFSDCLREFKLLVSSVSGNGRKTGLVTLCVRRMFGIASLSSFLR